MRDERESEDKKEENKVVDAEVSGVFTDARKSVGKVFRPRESGTIDEFGPWAALSEGLTEGR